jgi:hypothetical protein
MLPDKETTAPPAGAGVFNETVHVNEAPAISEAGRQLSPVRVAGIVMEAATPAMGSEFPEALAPKVLVTAIVVFAAIVKFTTATTPFCIGAPFNPARTHV